MDEQLKSHFLNLYHMALSDLNVDIKELEALYLIGEEKGLKKEEIDSIVLSQDEVEYIVPDSINDKIDSLYDLARIAWADDIIEDSERHLMNVFAEKFGFEKSNIPTIVQFLLDEAEKKTDKDVIFKIVTDNL